MNIQWNEDFEKMAHKVLFSMKCWPTIDHLGLAYECFAEKMDAYDETKCDNPVLYYGHRLREHIQYWRLYDNLVHIPPKKRGTHEVSYAYLDDPVGDSGSTLVDILGDPRGGIVEAPELTVEDICAMVDEEDRQLFIRHHVDEIDLTTLGDEIGVTRQAMHQKLSKIRSRLQRKLKASKKLD